VASARQRWVDSALTLGITKSDWQVTVTHLNATLDNFKVADNERTEILTMFAGVKRISSRSHKLRSALTPLPRLMIVV
jgi:hypothetical protein